MQYACSIGTGDFDTLLMQNTIFNSHPKYQFCMSIEMPLDWIVNLKEKNNGDVSNVSSNRPTDALLSSIPIANIYR